MVHCATGDPSPTTMIPNHSHFLDAIGQKRLVRIEFYSHPDGGPVDRECAPLDYGPMPGATDAPNRYWVWDPAATAGANPLGLLPDQIITLQVLGKDFDPASFGLGPRSWLVPREWGEPKGTATPAPGAPGS